MGDDLAIEDSMCRYGRRVVALEERIHLIKDKLVKEIKDSDPKSLVDDKGSHHHNLDNVAILIQKV